MCIEIVRILLHFSFQKFQEKDVIMLLLIFFFFLSKHRAFFITSKSYTIFCLKMARAIIIYNVQLFVYNFCQLFVLIWEVFTFQCYKKNWEGIDDRDKKLKDNKSFLLKRNNILRQIKWKKCSKDLRIVFSGKISIFSEKSQTFFQTKNPSEIIKSQNKKNVKYGTNHSAFFSLILTIFVWF